MSNFKRAPGTVAAAQRNVLASLKATTIVDSKPVLPAELLELVLNHLSVSDLAHVARVSRRMKEMVYDDGRWVQRLKSMGCWNDAEARQRVEEAMQRRTGTQGLREPENTKRMSATSAVASRQITGGGTSTNAIASNTLFDAGWEQDRAPLGRTLERRDAGGSVFESATFVSAGQSGPPQSTKSQDPIATLKVLLGVRSARGHARQEYAKIHAALAPYYLDLAQASSHTDPRIFQDFSDPQQQAEMLTQLRTFAKSDYAVGWTQRQEKLESLIGVFENAVLREFEQGLESQDIDGRMHRYAHVLTTLNGGAAGIDVFIQNNALMTTKQRFGSPLDCLPGGPHGPLLLHPAQEYFRQLAVELNQQSNIIDRVFPQHIDVLMPFIERIADDVLSEYITTLFDDVHEGDIEAYLKAVSGVYQSALRFAVSLVPSRASKPTFPEDTIAVVSRCFEQHVDLYMQEEIQFFKTKSESEVGAWEKRLSEQAANQESFFMSNVSRQAAKQDFLSSFKKVVMLPVNVLATPFNTAKPTVPMPSNRDSLAPGSRTSTPIPHDRSIASQNTAPTDELAAKAAIMNSRLEGIRSLFSIEVALNLIHTAKSSLERIALFVKMGGQSGEEARKQCEGIFVSLLQILGPRHVQSGFDKAVLHLSGYNPRQIGSHGQAGVEPLITFLELVNVGDLIQQMVDVFYVQELVTPKLSDSDDFLSPSVKEKKRFEQMLDERVAAGLNKGIDVLMDEIEYICGTTQLPTDYNPASPVQDIGPTETATRVVDIVSSHTDMLVGSTDKTMLDVFNQEVGLRLFTVLCKHLKRQRISVDGAIKLISDTNHYNMYIRSLRNKSLAQYFDALREMTQIYLIDAKDAKEIGRIIADPDRYHGIFRAEEVYEFAERRADWFSVKKNVERAMYGMGCVLM